MPRISLILTTFSVFLFEIYLTRIFSYIFTYHFTAFAVSTALLGLGVGAYVRVKFVSSINRAKILKWGHGALSLSLLVFVCGLGLSHQAAWVGFLSFLPFLTAGLLIPVYYEQLKSNHVNKTYFLDLLGGSLACISAALLLTVSDPISIILLLAFLQMWLSIKKASFFWMAGMGIFIWLIQPHVPDVLLHARSRLDKPLAQSIHQDKGQVSQSKWNIVGRADVYEDPGFPNIKWIYNDGTNSTLLTREPTLPHQIDILKNHFSYFPFLFQKPNKSLIIGSGGGLEINLNKLAGVINIDAVEINQAIVDVVNELRGFSGDIYNPNTVNLTIQDGRRFLIDHQSTYDLIQLSLVLTAAAQSGTYALAEASLYTTQAFKDYLLHLSDNGLVALIDDAPERTIRQFITAATVLMDTKNLTEKEALSHLLVIENQQKDITGYRYLLLLSQKRFTKKQARNLIYLTRDQGFFPMYIPGYQPSEPFKTIFENGIDNYIQNASLNFNPVSDDAPFFFNFSKKLKFQMKIFMPSIIIILLAVVGVTLMLKEKKKITKPSFLALTFGIGFMLIELGLLQKLTLAIGDPAQTLTVLLFSLLLWCGLGSLLSKKLGPSKKISVETYSMVVALVSALTALFLDRYYLFAFIPNEFNRLVCVVFSIAPLGLVLGIPFPTLLNQQGGKGQLQLAHLWGMNGWGSIAGASIFVVLTHFIGTTHTLIIGSTIYLVPMTLKYIRKLA